MKKYLLALIIGIVAHGVAESAITGGSNMGAVNARAYRASSNQMPNVVRAATPTVTVAATEQVTEINTTAKQECVARNQGMANTFVWASISSNGENYYDMVEDVANPENNTCWVKVELTATDPRIAMANVKPRYYPLGNSIDCGSWADEGDLRNKILNAKKTGRTWGTVAGVVGGAGVGVGAMELFGNKMIGGKVQGQVGMSEDELRDANMTPTDRAQYETLQKELESLCAVLINSGLTSEYCE